MSCFYPRTKLPDEPGVFAGTKNWRSGAGTLLNQHFVQKY
jgi:hypothetical protein